MKILKSSQIKEVDSFTIKTEPVKSIDLMERAAMSISQWIVKNISKDKIFKVFVGPGNNGGDSLAIARQLIDLGYKLEIYLVKLTDKLSINAEINRNRLEKNNILINEIKGRSDFPKISNNEIIIDGLFGSGLTRKLEGLAKEIVQYINKSKSKIISIDIPSGLFGENNGKNEKDAIIKAKHTLSFQMPKLSFLFSDNNEFVGNWEVMPIGLNQGFINKTESDYYITTSDDVKKYIIDRKKFSHKGTYGHVLMVSGSYGKMGAAILASKACLRTGSGLVSVHIPKVAYSVMQTALPEAMVSIDWSDIIITNVPDVEKYTAIAVGPGIGTKQNTQKALGDLFEKVKTAMVIDADALNILAKDKELINKIPKNSILTPHPKEFERLLGKYPDDYERMQQQIEFAIHNQLYIVLKGAYTSIACPNGEIYFNSTGNPGMATAGSGDVLTGMIISLLGQGYNSKDAAIFAVYLHGLAGDIAAGKISEEALIASDIIENIGNAYNKVRL